MKKQIDKKRKTQNIKLKTTKKNQNIKTLYELLIINTIKYSYLKYIFIF